MRARARSSCVSSTSTPGAERPSFIEGNIVENSPPLSNSRRRAALAFIFVTLLIDILAFGLIIPVLPHLILGFVGNDDGLAARWYMLFSVAFFTMQFFF